MQGTDEKRPAEKPVAFLLVLREAATLGTRLDLLARRRLELANKSVRLDEWPSYLEVLQTTTRPNSRSPCRP